MIMVDNSEGESERRRVMGVGDHDVNAFPCTGTDRFMTEQWNLTSILPTGVIVIAAFNNFRLGLPYNPSFRRPEKVCPRPVQSFWELFIQGSGAPLYFANS